MKKDIPKNKDNTLENVEKNKQNILLTPPRITRISKESISCKFIDIASIYKESTEE